MSRLTKRVARTVCSGRLVAALASIAAASMTTACASRATDELPSAQSAGAEAPYETAILLSIPTAEGSIRLPFARGRVGNVEGYFLLDTGAGWHVVSRTAADRAGLALEPVAVTAVAQGAQRAADVALVATGAAELAGWPAPLRSPLVLALPAVFDEAGIIGIVSPQLLATDRRDVVLDLGTATMSSVDAEIDTAGDAPAYHVCSVAAEPVGELLFLVAASVDAERVSMLLDTGGTTTTAFAGTPLAARLSERARPTEEGGIGLAGTFEVAEVPVEVRVDQRSTTVVASVQAGRHSEQCPASGHLGMDLLTGCRIRLGVDHVVLRCGATTTAPG